ncbi:hypothetical protein A2118_01555 [Candidatus Kaiserbacteria bacterium GWA2_50_9]|uniref:Bro-N domain-containing protein n=1 Tax=Candidatus Kaiserbacteria bacterium GWA2_50_9 TaxID=1798474 RepID=A0A1F6BV61_9BACT|nr:MAG: hypothetical protein A2118_01555 [Candidatus Kaiserbacteria bacterium GWA2_50_9]
MRRGLTKENTALENTKITLFKGKGVRKILHKNEWWFSVVDVVEAVTESERPRKYWSDLKKRLIQEGYTQLSEKIGQLKLLSADGKYYETDCGNTETMFRIVQSITSPKAEPFKRWLAKAGGDIAGGARKKLEKRLDRSIVTKKNYIKNPENKKLLQ